MVKIRLTRVGKKNDPFYRIVAIDSQKKRGGRALEIMGFWHPKKGAQTINKEAIVAWEKKGAQISARVKKLLA
jgi:small subunit ribosomal protein S16